VTIGGVRVYSIYAPNGRKVGTDAHRFKLAWCEFLGLVDVIRARAGENPAFTWWNRRGDFYETDRGWRLDHALASASVAGRVSAARFDQLAWAEPGPDHAPIVLEIAAMRR
jgi:exonuclease III